MIHYNFYKPKCKNRYTQPTRLEIHVQANHFGKKIGIYNWLSFYTNISYKLLVTGTYPALYFRL